MSTGLATNGNGSTNGRPPAPLSARVRRSLTGRIAGWGPSYFGYGKGSQLPETADDAEQAWGCQIYDTMSLDPAVRACELILACGVVGDGLKLAPAAQADIAKQDGGVGQNPEIALAEQIRDECQWVAERLLTPVDDLAFDFVSMARRRGHRMAELVWEDASDPEGRNRLALKEVATLPRRAYAFVVDPYMEVVAIRVTPAGGGMYQDADPTFKFCWFTPQPRERDPRGESAYRPAYDPWLSKSKTKPQRYQYNHRFAAPIVIAIEPENPPTVIGDDDTEVDFSVDAGDRLATLQGGNYLIWPHGGDVKLMEAAGQGEAFEKTFDRDNREIALALLTNSRTILEAEHSSKADAQAAKDVTDTVVGLYRRKMATFFRDQIFYPYVLLNHGKVVADRLTPDVSFGSGSQEDTATLLNAFAAWARFYPTTEAQLRWADMQLGAPVRDFGAEVFQRPTPPQLAGVTGSTSAPATGDTGNATGDNQGGPPAG